MDDSAPTEIGSTRPKGYESMPYLNQKRRVTGLWPGNCSRGWLHAS